MVIEVEMRGGTHVLVAGSLKSAPGRGGVGQTLEGQLLPGQGEFRGW